jgi:hypothetical protein
MKFETGDNVRLENPTKADVEWELRCLSSANGFAILTAKTNAYFMQAHIRNDGLFDLEYRDGSAQAHFECEGVPLTAVQEAFASYIDNGDFRTRWPWRPLEM